jgi:protein O-mannosyl-transferase
MWPLRRSERRQGKARHRDDRIRQRRVVATAAATRNPVVAIVAAALVALTLVAYFPALRGDFVWDDNDYVSNNPTLRSGEGLRAIWFDPTATPQYYPLVHSSYWLEYHLWGLDPLGYHLTNVALHLASAFLLWRILQFLGVRGAWLVAAIFAVHPVHVESVAWITERKNVLSGVFYLSAMLIYLPLALDPDALPAARRRWKYGVVCALFLLALLSKTVTASLPAALLLLIAWKRGRVRWPDVWPLLPLVIIGLAGGLVTMWLEAHHVGAQGVDWQLSPLQRIVIAGRALWFYAAKLAWPTNLTFIYPRWRIDPADPWQLAYPGCAGAAIAALWLARRRIGAGPLVAVLLFAGTLFPALGFIDTFPMRYSFVADHFQYLASAALIALAVGAAAHLIRRWPSPRVRFARACSAVVVLVLAAFTWRQSHAYQDHEALWRDTIQKDPASWMGHTSLGALYGQRGASAEAEAHYREAVRLNPDFAIARTNLAGLLANQGRFDEAIPHYREAVRLDPTSVEAHVSLGRALLLNGNPLEAAKWFRLVVERWPTDPRGKLLLDAALAGEHR